MIHGLNMEKGLENTGGDLAFYKGLLQDFFDTYSNHAEKIIQFVSKGDYQAAELEAHSLKGTSRMLGFEQAYDIALKLEMSLKEKNEEMIRLLIPPLSNELKNLFWELEQSDLLKKETEEHLTLKLDEQQKRILLDQLNALRPVVRSGRYQAEELVSQLLKEYADFGLKKKLLELKTLINQLEYQKALALIKSIQKEL
ncbi:MAG: Hpt domain-containing protein [Thermotogota bacterium]